MSSQAPGGRIRKMRMIRIILSGRGTRKKEKEDKT